MDLNFSIIDDTIFIQENLVIGQNPMKTLSVFESIVTSDYGDVFNRPFISVGDDILADTVNTLVEILPSITVSEVITVTDEGGITQDRNVDVNEPVTISEVTNSGFQLLFISVFETTINVLDFATRPSVPIDLFVSDVVAVGEVPVEEFGIVLIIGRSLTVFENTAVSEFSYIGKEIIDINIFDTITTVEAPILGRNPENLVSFQPITVLDTAFCQTALDLAFNDFLRSYPFVEETITNVISEVFENGAEQRRDKWGRTRKRFQITFAPRLKVEIDQVRAFYEAHKGPAKSFEFKNPLDSVDYLVRFEDNTFAVSRDAYNIYSARATLVEVFA